MSPQRYLWWKTWFHNRSGLQWAVLTFSHCYLTLPVKSKVEHLGMQRESSEAKQSLGRVIKPFICNEGRAAVPAARDPRRNKNIKKTNSFRRDLIKTNSTFCRCKARKNRTFINRINNNPARKHWVTNWPTLGQSKPSVSQCVQQISGALNMDLSAQVISTTAHISVWFASKPCAGLTTSTCDTGCEVSTRCFRKVTGWKFTEWGGLNMRVTLKEGNQTSQTITLCWQICPHKQKNLASANPDCETAGTLCKAETKLRVRRQNIECLSWSASLSFVNISLFCRSLAVVQPNLTGKFQCFWVKITLNSSPPL